jgi:hypothetical protein
MTVAQVIRDSNRDVGGRVVEMAETEYMVRGRGYLRGKADIEGLVVRAEGGTPVLIRDIARVELAAGRTARHHRAQRRGRGGVRHRHGTLRAERARRDPQRQGQAGRDQQPACPRASPSSGLRPLRADPPRDRRR